MSRACLKTAIESDQMKEGGVTYFCHLSVLKASKHVFTSIHLIYKIDMQIADEISIRLSNTKLTSNLAMNSAKIPKKLSVVVVFPSSPKNDATLQNSSIASCCRDSRDCTAGWLFSRNPYMQVVKVVCHEFGKYQQHSVVEMFI